MSYKALIYTNLRWISHRLLLIMLVGAMLFGSVVTGGVGVAQAQTVVSGPVIVRPGGAQLYDAPNGAVIDTLPLGEVFTAIGRSADQSWVIGATATGKGGWLQVAQVIAVGVDLLPVVDETVASSSAGNAAVETEGETISASPTVTNSAPTTATTGSGIQVTGLVDSGDQRLNVRSGPGTAYSVVAKAMSGESYPIIGRSQNGAWLQIDRGNGETGWVSATYIKLSGDISLLPIVMASSPPSSTAVVTTNQTAAPSGAAVSGLSGTLVIQSSPGGMFYAYSLDDGALWPLTNGFDPAISPDGQTVTFARDGGENGIYLIDIDGSDERLIWSGRQRLSSPKWSPDGQWILFTRSDDSYQCLEFGAVCMSLPSVPGGAPNPFAGEDLSTRYWYNLARVDRDGNNYRDIASLQTAREADWNEAGIVYQSAAGLQITADLPDAENKLVIFDYLKPFYDDPDWQPHGGRIVYMGKEASHWEIFSLNPDGSDRRALTRPVTTVVDEIPSNVAPAWSPDGQHIVFLSNRDENHEAGAWRVWVMDADGSNQRPLGIDLAINYTFGGEQSLSWAQ